jgi:hypothetical protein
VLSIQSEFEKQSKEWSWDEQLVKGRFEDTEAWSILTVKAKKNLWKTTFRWGVLRDRPRSAREEEAAVLFRNLRYPPAVSIHNWPLFHHWISPSGVSLRPRKWLIVENQTQLSPHKNTESSHHLEYRLLRQAESAPSWPGSTRDRVEDRVEDLNRSEDIIGLKNKINFVPQLVITSRSLLLISINC